MATGRRSPGRRRSPRFQLQGLSERQEETPESHNSRGNTSNHRRRLQFHESVEPLSVPSSVHARPDPYSLHSTNSLFTIPPDSDARRFSDMDTVAPNSEARQFSDMDTAAPNSEARRFSDMESRSPPIPEGTAPTSRNVHVMVPAEVDAAGPSETGARTERGAELAQDGSEEISESERQTQVRVSSAEEMSRVFSFISQIPVKKLRALLKHWDWRQGGNKRTLAAKDFLHVRLSLLSGKDVLETLSTHDETRRYESWLRVRLEKNETYPVTIHRAPPEADLLKLLANGEAAKFRRNKISVERARSRCNPNREDVAGRNGDHNARKTSTDPSNPGEESARAIDANADSSMFSISEFARLLIIMGEDEDACAAVIGLGQQLSRAQLDAGVKRGDLWEIVESRFNDPSVNHFLNMAGYVDGVDSSLPPQRFRSAAFLKEKFNDSKASFTTFVSRWSSSGQNDPERFRHFVPKLPSGDLNALGKRMMVMFVCTRKGTPHEEADFTNVCCKLIPGGAGRDEGSNQGSSLADEGERGHHANAGRKRRSSQNSDSIKEMASSISRLATSYENKKSSSQSDVMLQEYSCRLKKIKILEDVEKKLANRALQPIQAASDTTDGDATVVLALKKLKSDMGKDLLRPSGGDEVEAYRETTSRTNI